MRSARKFDRIFFLCVPSARRTALEKPTLLGPIIIIIIIVPVEFVPARRVVCGLDKYSFDVLIVISPSIVAAVDNDNNDEGKTTTTATTTKSRVRREL